MVRNSMILATLALALGLPAHAATSTRRVPGTNKVIVKVRNPKTGNTSVAVWQNGQRKSYQFNGAPKYFPSK